MCKHIGVYTPVTWFSDVKLSEDLVTKGFFTSFLFTDILLTFFLTSLFYFHSFFISCYLDFVVFMDD